MISIRDFFQRAEADYPPPRVRPKKIKPEKCLNCVWCNDCGDVMMCAFPHCVEEKTNGTETSDCI